MAASTGSRYGPDRPDGPDDREAIAASFRDPVRFAVVFDRHYEQIWSYLSRRAGRAVADELASETFVRAFAARSGYDLAYPDARPWLYGIATNLLRRHARTEERRRRAYARAIERDEVSGELDAVAARVDACAGARVVAGALSRLAPTDRDTLLLFALTDLGYEGVALATGVPVGTVRSRLHRVRRHLRAALSASSELDPIDERSRA